MTPPSLLVLHHTASPRTWTRAAVLRSHLARGFRDIGYHELVLMPPPQPAAHVVQGRPYDLDNDWEPWEYGAHVRGQNSRSWGCALVGNFETQEPPASMLRAASVLFTERCLRWDLDPFVSIRGHRELAATACPGRHIDMDAFRRRVAELL